MNQRKTILYLLGIGTGSVDSMTLGCQRILEEADVIFGASRVLDAVGKVKGEKIPVYQSDKICDYISAHGNEKLYAAAYSGDTGFFSGAAAMKRYLLEKGDDSMDVRILPGISSLSYFAAKTGFPYQSAKILSRHGRSCYLISQVRRHEDCFVILSGAEDLKRAVKELAGASVKGILGELSLTYGYQLSYPEEVIAPIKAFDVDAVTEEGLYVLWIRHLGASHHVVTPGLPDEAFLRDKVPMTKEEIRVVSLCKLHLTKRSVVWDVGAGSGSVSVEAAAMCPEGEVYAIEKKEKALELLKANKEHFAADNMIIVPGSAPESLKDLPSPDHVFIGGSGGEMEGVLQTALEKNPHVRVVINAVTIETISESVRLLEKLPFTGTEIIEMQVSRAEVLGHYHLMKAMNPVYILSADGNGQYNKKRRLSNDK